ncbi:hypothetical protein GEMRC1_012676 [Eukaryota sp. GEM-RC1]
MTSTKTPESSSTSLIPYPPPLPSESSSPSLIPSPPLPSSSPVTAVEVPVETKTPDTTVEEKNTRKRRNRRRSKKSKTPESSSASSPPLPSSSPPDTTVETETPDTTVETETPDTTVEEKSTRKRRNRRRPKKSKSSESSSASSLPSSLPSPSASSIPSSSLPSRPATTLTYVAATTDFVEDKVSKSKYPANNGFPEEAMIFNCINDAGEIIGRKVEVSPDSYFLPLTARKYRMNEERDLVKKGGRSITPHNLAQLRISRIIHIFGLPFEAAKSLNSLQSNLTSNVEKGKGKATLVFNELLRIPL